MSCGIGCRCSMDLAGLWLWRRPAAAALIRPLAWEPPYAAGTAPPPKKSFKGLFEPAEVQDDLTLATIEVRYPWLHFTSSGHGQNTRFEFQCPNLTSSLVILIKPNLDRGLLQHSLIRHLNSEMQGKHFYACKT